MKPDINSIENSIDPDQLALEKPADQYPLCFLNSMQVYSNMKYRIAITFFKLVPGQVNRNF